MVGRKDRYVLDLLHDHLVRTYLSPRFAGVLVVGGHRLEDGSISVTQFPVRFTELVRPMIEDMQVMRAHDRMLETRYHETMEDCRTKIREKESNCQKLILEISQDHETKLSELLEKHKAELAGLQRENEYKIEELLKTAAVRENDLRIENAFVLGQNEVLKVQIAEQAAEIERLKAVSEKLITKAAGDRESSPADAFAVPLAKVVDETNRIHRAAFDVTHGIQIAQAAALAIQEIAVRLAEKPEMKKNDFSEDRGGL